MKPTTITKINPIVEMIFPVLLQCKDGECGTCPRNTGKLLWIPKLWQVGEDPVINFKYDFFDKSAESEEPIKYNWVESNTLFDNKPDKQYATDTPAIDTFMSPSLMKLGNTLSFGFGVYSSSTVGMWAFFRQPNPAIGNIHDALCFEYNHEKRLITFRSF